MSATFCNKLLFLKKYEPDHILDAFRPSNNDRKPCSFLPATIPVKKRLLK
ncbi:Uncharacterised protein [Yersinia enterocolitica]|nr:Uncharacterised protein [Yersinia enterocolitica]